MGLTDYKLMDDLLQSILMKVLAGELCVIQMYLLPEFVS